MESGEERGKVGEKEKEARENRENIMEMEREKKEGRRWREVSGEEERRERGRKE